VDEEECFTPSDPDADSTGRRLLDETVVDLVEVCPKDCFRDVAATAQTISVPLLSPTKVDVSVDALGIPRTQLLIPSGAFGESSYIVIEPVPMSELDGGDRAFADIVLSTPFRCRVGSLSEDEQFDINVTVNAYVDRKRYFGGANADDQDADSDDDSADGPLVPCELQATYSVSYDAEDKSACSGSAVVTDTTIELDMGSCDDDYNFEAELTSRDIRTFFDGKTSESCLCFTVTKTDSDYDKKKLWCALFIRYAGGVDVRFFGGTNNATQCPAGTSTGGLRVYRLTRDVTESDDACESATSSANSAFVLPENMCFGFLRDNEWQCIQGRDERIANPVWDDNSGTPPDRVSSRFPSCEEDVYAFLQIDLPPEPIKKKHVLSWWEKYRVIILSTSGSFIFFLILSSYALSRLIRYRKKYKQQKQELNALHEKAKELDEYAGGLGIADEEVDMVANPLVVEMQELQDQIDKVNKEMNLQEQKDEQEMDGLERERRRLFDEIKRVKDEMAKAQKAAPTRTTEQAPAPLLAAVGPTSSSTALTNTPVRHEFGQMQRGASKKKAID